MQQHKVNQTDNRLMASFPGQPG